MTLKRDALPVRSYTGIGSRSTPPMVFDRMRALARELAAEGYELRSGGADGADTAFELGCDDVQIDLAAVAEFPGPQGGTDRSDLPPHT